MTTSCGYDRSRLVPSVVHIGPGVFHRAHQAVYSDDLLRAGATDAAIWAISLRSRAVADALAPDAFEYHVIEVADGAAGDGARATRIGALLGVDTLAGDPEPALARLTHPAVRVVTITVTEHGYCAVRPGGPLELSRDEIVHDLASPTLPRSLPGLLVEALTRRRAVGIAPFAVVSCDNIAANGLAVARVVGELADARGGDLADWIRGNVDFPSTMVDRMVPTTSADEIARARSLGIADAWPIVTEPFRQWVIEDQFPAGRPAWDAAGAELVADVSDHEQAKLRILNAAHSALAYWGLLAGHRYIWQAVADPVLRAATIELVEREAIPTLATPHGWDLRAYAATVLDRFANRALPYTTAKVAGDGSQKLPVRVMPTVHANAAAGRPAPRCAHVLAAWAAVMAGPERHRFGVVDAALGEVGALDAETAVRGLLGRPGFVAGDDTGGGAFVAGAVEVARSLWAGDVRRVLTGGSFERGGVP